MVEYNKLKNKSGIYCFKNKVNGKCYIGQALDLRKRLRAHYSAYRNGKNKDLALYKAFYKYGIDNFDLSIVEIVEFANKEILDQLEVKYIKEYKAFGETGYNMTVGGDGGVLGLKMTDSQKENIKTGMLKSNPDFIKKICARKVFASSYFVNMTYEQAVEKSGVSRSVISKICNRSCKKLYSKGWTFAFTELELYQNTADALRDYANGADIESTGKFTKGDQKLINILSRPVKKLNEHGEVIQTFPSIKQAAKDIGCNPSTLSEFLRNDKRKYFHGEIFK